MPNLSKAVKLAIILIFSMLIPIMGLNCPAMASTKINDIILDNSDRLILVQGSASSVSTMALENPSRYVIDFKDAVLIGASRDYKLNNSNTISNIKLSQFSKTPEVVRMVITVNKPSDTTKFKIYKNQNSIVIKYNSQIIDNSIQYKFYTPSGDMDKSAKIQNTGASVTYNNNFETLNLIPQLQTKYYLSQIAQNSDGLILRGIGEISFQKALYSADNTVAEFILDNASMSNRFNDRTYRIPTTTIEEPATLTLNKLSNKKIKLTLQGNNIRDYRFVVSPDAQSLFISHRTYVINTNFSSQAASVKNYSASKTQSGYKLFDFTFDKNVTYDVFELNGNFYLDINNLSDFNQALFDSAFKEVKESGINIQGYKIAADKTRFVIPMNKLNFSYANIESNSKSIKLCFREQNASTVVSDITIANTPAKTNSEKPIAVIDTKDNNQSQNINVVYIPKDEDSQRVQKPKKVRENTTISSMKKVVLDPGHGGSDCGAIALDNKYYEKTINLEVALMVKERLEKKNIYVYMTRTKDTTLTLEDRVNYSNDISPDIYVSIHANSTLQHDTIGLETHYYKDNSLALANTVHKHFASDKNLKKWNTKDRGVMKSRFYVINHTEAPSILIEMGFISNKLERDDLNTKDRKEALADSIAKGILEYLKN